MPLISILLVEDDPVQARIVRAMLGRVRGLARVTHVDDLSGAIKALRAEI